ncbi:hypothetical protein AB6D15_24745, partial [Vibrio splendidus]
MTGFNHGGSRPGSGRKKGVGSTVVRVPNSILADVLNLISSHKLGLCNDIQKGTSHSPILDDKLTDFSNGELIESSNKNQNSSELDTCNENRPFLFDSL